MYRLEYTSELHFTFNLSLNENLAAPLLGITVYLKYTPITGTSSSQPTTNYLLTTQRYNGTVKNVL